MQPETMLYGSGQARGRSLHTSGWKSICTYVHGKLVFWWLVVRFARERRELRPLAVHLETVVFPELREEGIKHLDVSATSDEAEPRLCGATDGHPRLVFPGTKTLAQALERSATDAIRLDVKLEMGQIVEAFLLLFYVTPVLEREAPETAVESWRRGALAAAMRSDEGLHRLCAVFQFDTESRVFRVGYSYCELVMSAAIRNYLDHRSLLGDHRALFRAAPRVALVVFLLVAGGGAFVAVNAVIGVVEIILVAIFVSLLTGSAVHALGSMQYDREHHDMLLKQYEKELREANRKLRRMSDVKDEFMRIASHDVKNPLTVIELNASLLKRSCPPGTTVTDKMQQAVTRILNSSGEIKGIISDFLDFRAIEDDHIRIIPEPVDLDELVKAVVDHHDDRAAAKQITLQASLINEGRMIGDAARLRQVIDNLVGNAIKFSPSGGAVHVSVRRNDDVFRVEVRDNGPGLTETDMQQVFQRYARLSNKPTGGEKSSGLGLYICRHLVERHGGEIGVFNADDGGAVFWFSVPSHKMPSG